MSDETQDPDELLGFLAEEGRQRRDPDEHPTPEILTAYHANELSPEEDERFQNHLAVCRQCTELLLELDEFLKPPAAEPVADFEAAADRRTLREGLRGVEKKTPVRPDRRRFIASVWGGYCAAAALLVISVGLGIWNAELFRELRKPQPIRTVQTLTAHGSTRGVDVEGEPVVLPAEIILPLSTEAPESFYRINIIRDGSRRSEWSFDVPQSNGDLSFRLPEKSLSPGSYTLEVVAPGKGRRNPAPWTYRLRIVPSA